MKKLSNKNRIKLLKKHIDFLRKQETEQRHNIEFLLNNNQLHIDEFRKVNDRINELESQLNALETYQDIEREKETRVDKVWQQNADGSFSWEYKESPKEPTISPFKPPDNQKKWYGVTKDDLLRELGEFCHKYINYVGGWSYHYSDNTDGVKLEKIFTEYKIKLKALENDK